MKKATFFAAVLLITLASCQKPLPENIKNAIGSVNYWTTLVNAEDSIICSLTQNKINALSTDSIMKLIWLQDSFTKSQWKSSLNTLEQLLIHNPEYSSYEEVKNGVPSYLNSADYNENYLTNTKYLRDIYIYRTAYIKPAEVPEYGFFKK